MMSAFTVLVTTRIWQLAAVNLMTLCLIIFGLGVFGLAPAFVAALWAVGRLDEISVADLARGMWRQFRAEFWRANCIVGLPLAAIVFAAWSATYFSGLIGALMITVAVMAALHAVAALITLAQMSGGLRDGWANAATALRLAPYRLLLCVMLIPLIAIAVAWQPPLGLYFALSVWALATHLIVQPGLASAIPTPTFSKTEVLP